MVIGPNRLPQPEIQRTGPKNVTVDTIPSGCQAPSRRCCTKPVWRPRAWRQLQDLWRRPPYSASVPIILSHLTSHVDKLWLITRWRRKPQTWICVRDLGRRLTPSSYCREASHQVGHVGAAKYASSPLHSRFVYANGGSFTKAHHRSFHNTAVRFWIVQESLSLVKVQASELHEVRKRCHIRISTRGVTAAAMTVIGTQALSLAIAIQAAPPKIISLADQDQVLPMQPTSPHDTQQLIVFRARLQQDQQSATSIRLAWSQA